MSARTQLGPVEKTAFLTALERVGNTSSKEQLSQIRALLASGQPLLQIFETLHPQQSHGVEEEEMTHVGRDWFHPTKGWWTKARPEQVMREGLIRSIDLSLQYGEPGADGKPFPVDYWWVNEAGAFRFISKISAQQQTVFLLTPTAPIPGAPTRAPVRAKARKTAKKAQSKTARKKASKKAAKKAKRR